jgi:hypothetical protein
MVVEKGTFMTFGLTTNTRAGKSQNFTMGEMLKAAFSGRSRLASKSLSL